ncbi:hypothetical protein [Pectobacterium atrosepticum]|uniref:hypothetical protein n=1 Tax=Pectobacterium atrosepticum TaxID=29471 RepID=UPI000C28BEA1|nr:hypothetical protein [Pectobacterium atrosepticum]ATY89859.1 hypothetical protein CVS35_05555 [Pectobacterium atrosepticum]MCA6980415.1 hypothetical protein [Pectobacterium atrosepticum]MCH5021591.1 hypothetical protein [Pectobacterium atrosepticum]
MDDKNECFSKEEKLIKLIDRYISDSYKHDDDIFTYKLYLIFVGYHLKYFYPNSQYCYSISNIDNIMHMFCSVFKCMKRNFIHDLQNKEFIFVQLNALVDYIEGNQLRLEQVYAELKAQYELKEISSRVTKLCKPKRPRL